MCYERGMNLHMLTRSGWVLFAIALFFSLASVRLITRSSRGDDDNEEAAIYLATAISVAWFLWLVTP